MIIGFICGLGKNVSQLKYALVGHRVRTLRTLSPLLTDQESAKDGLKLSPNSHGDLLVYLYLCSVIANEVMTEQEIFKKEAENGYTVCFAEQCPLKEQCLRYLVGQQMPDTRSFYHCVNPRYQDVGTERCSLFRSSKKVKFAKGMMHIFNADMPRRVEPFVRQRLIGKHCRTYYYEYRNGTRLISPAIQEEVRSLFREAGWKEEVNFDGYVEDYEW